MHKIKNSLIIEKLLHKYYTRENLNMKILICTQELYISGGVARVITDKANYLSQVFGYEVIIVCYQEEKQEKFFKLNSKIKVVNLNINYSELENEKNFLLKKIKYFFKRNKHKKAFRSILEEVKPDIITAWEHTSSSICSSIRIRCKKILECHVDKENFLGIERKKFLFKITDKFRRRKLEVDIRKKWDAFVILTEEGREQWLNLKKIENIRVIPNSLPFYSKRVSKCENKTIISVGRLENQKGYDDLIIIWNNLFKKYPDWKLEIYGEGSLRKELQEKIDSLNMSNSLFLKNNEKNITEKYIESSIYIMTSRYEGMPMVLLEAMSCGIPVVSFSCPCGPKDIIKDGEDGFLIKNRDLDEMVNKLEFLIQNEEKRKVMGKKAHENIARYSKNKVMLQWKFLYEELLNKK